MYQSFITFVIILHNPLYVKPLPDDDMTKLKSKEITKDIKTSPSSGTNMCVKLMVEHFRKDICVNGQNFIAICRQ